VPSWPVQPNVPGRVHVACSHLHDFAGPHAGEALQLDHRPDVAGDVRADGLNVSIGNRPDRFRLTGGAPASRQADDRIERLRNGHGDKLKTDCPTKDALDAPDPLVDDVAAQAGVNHLLADRAESQGTEFTGERVPVQLADGPQGESEVAQLARRFAGGITVVLFGVLPEPQEQFIDCQVAASLGIGWRSPAVGFPLANEADVFGAGQGGPVRAEQHVSATAEAVGEGDNGLPGLTMTTIGRDGTRTARHAAYPILRKNSAQ
jgi:hypothetical protein